MPADICLEIPFATPSADIGRHTPDHAIDAHGFCYGQALKDSHDIQEGQILQLDREHLPVREHTQMFLPVLFHPCQITAGKDDLYRSRIESFFF